MTRVTQNNIQTLNKNQVFVFGSNNEGKHYGGAAKLAFEKFGAIMGKAHGIQGNCYAINSMSGMLFIKIGVKDFIEYAKLTPEKTFLVTEIGCGIAGYEPEDIAPLFKECLDVENVFLPQRFIDVIQKNLGTFKDFN